MRFNVIKGLECRFYLFDKVTKEQYPIASALIDEKDLLDLAQSPLEHLGITDLLKLRDHVENKIKEIYQVKQLVFIIEVNQNLRSG